MSDELSTHDAREVIKRISEDAVLQYALDVFYETHTSDIALGGDEDSFAVDVRWSHADEEGEGNPFFVYTARLMVTDLYHPQQWETEQFRIYLDSKADGAPAYRIMPFPMPQVWETPEAMREFAVNITACATLLERMNGTLPKPE